MGNPIPNSDLEFIDAINHCCLLLTDLLIALPILLIVPGLPIFGLFPSPLPASDPSCSVGSLLIAGPRFFVCVGVISGVSSPLSLGAVTCVSRGFGFSGVGVGISELSVDSASLEVGPAGATRGGSCLVVVWESVTVDAIDSSD